MGFCLLGRVDGLDGVQSVAVNDDAAGEGGQWFWRGVSVCGRKTGGCSQPPLGRAKTRVRSDVMMASSLDVALHYQGWGGDLATYPVERDPALPSGVSAAS